MSMGMALGMFLGMSLPGNVPENGSAQVLPPQLCSQQPGCPGSLWVDGPALKGHPAWAHKGEDAGIGVSLVAMAMAS